MAQTINTNIASLTAQRNLAASQKDAATAMQRLSSGLRINSAKDDAAGLSIASKLQTQISGINQAVRNANDGISVVQIAEGALQESTDLLRRMRDLAVQSANATLTSTERTSLNNEVTQLKSELDRIATTTSFGDAKLLNGTFTSKSFQVGAQVGEIINLSINSTKSADIGTTYDVTGILGGLNKAEIGTTNGVTAQNLVIGVGSESTTVGVAVDSSAKTIAADISAQVGGLQASASTTTTLTFDDATAPADTSTIITINGQALTMDFSGTKGDSVLKKGTLLKAQIDANAVLSANLDVSIDGAGLITLTDSDGDNITVASDSTNEASDNDMTMTTNSVAIAVDENVTGVATGAITLTGSTSAAVTAYSDTDTTVSGSASVASPEAATETANNNRVSTVDISTVNGANTAIGTIDAALATLNTERATLGATQNRFDSVVSNLMNVAENTAAAKSRIMDADFATETAQLARTQILQQAGISVLAQANAQPQNVLALLQ